MSNSAAIFFDFNEPVNTNTATTVFTPTISIVENEVSAFTITPNPVHDIATVRFSDSFAGGQLYIFDAMGKMIRNEKISSSTTHLSLEDLQSGLYFITVEQDGMIIGRKKVVVE